MHDHTGGTTNQLILALDGEAAEAETWLEHEHRDSNAVFSPDGRFVAFLSTRTGQHEVYIRPYPGPGGQTSVSVGGGREPLWAPTGELFYRRTRDSMVVEVSSGEAGDGGAQGAKVVIVQNWVEELRERVPVD